MFKAFGVLMVHGNIPRSIKNPLQKNSIKRWQNIFAVFFLENAELAAFMANILNFSEEKMHTTT